MIVRIIKGFPKTEAGEDLHVDTYLYIAFKNSIIYRRYTVNISPRLALTGSPIQESLPPSSTVTSITTTATTATAQPPRRFQYIPSPWRERPRCVGKFAADPATRIPTKQWTSPPISCARFLWQHDQWSLTTTVAQARCLPVRVCVLPWRRLGGVACCLRRNTQYSLGP